MHLYVYSNIIIYMNYWLYRSPYFKIQIIKKMGFIDQYKNKFFQK